MKIKLKLAIILIFALMMSFSGCDFFGSDSGSSGGGGGGTATTFDSADTPGDTVTVTVGSETTDFIYANDQTGINFPFSPNQVSPVDNQYATLTKQFFLSKIEVTNALYAEVLQWAYDNNKFNETGSTLTTATADYRAQQLIDLDDTFCRITYTASPAAGDPNFIIDSGYDEHPVVCVTWYGTVIFCNWLTEMRDGVGSANVVYAGIPAAGTTWDHDDTVADDSKTGYRLPTSAEWEYSARYVGTSDGGRTDLVSQNTNNGHSSLTAGYFWTKAAYASGATADYNNETATRAVAWYSGDTDMGAGGDKLMPAAKKAANQLGLYDMSGNAYEWCFDLYIGSSRVGRGGGWIYTANFMQAGYWDDDSPVNESGVMGFRFARTK